MIGERIKSIRNKKGISLSELATRANVAKSYLSSIERGLQTNPSIQFIEKISEVLEINLQTLLENGESDQVQDILDDEWLQLAQEAQESGISKQQFKEYLEFAKWQKNKS